MTFQEEIQKMLDDTLLKVSVVAKENKHQLDQIKNTLEEALARIPSQKVTFNLKEKVFTLLLIIGAGHGLFELLFEIIDIFTR